MQASLHIQSGMEFVHCKQCQKSLVTKISWWNHQLCLHENTGHTHLWQEFSQREILNILQLFTTTLFYLPSYHYHLTDVPWGASWQETGEWPKNDPWRRSFITILRYVIKNASDLFIATPRHATPRHATPRHATPRHATPRHATPRHANVDAHRICMLSGESWVARLCWQMPAWAMTDQDICQ